MASYFLSTFHRPWKVFAANPGGHHGALRESQQWLPALEVLPRVDLGFLCLGWTGQPNDQAKSLLPFHRAIKSWDACRLRALPSHVRYPCLVGLRPLNRTEGP